MTIGHLYSFQLRVVVTVRVQSFSSGVRKSNPFLFNIVHQNHHQFHELIIVSLTCSKEELFSFNKWIVLGLNKKDCDRFQETEQVGKVRKKFLTLCDCTVSSTQTFLPWVIRWNNLFRNVNKSECHSAEHIPLPVQGLIQYETLKLCITLNYKPPITA